LDTIIPSLKESILKRDGGPESLDKVVIRPDSGDPADILCGNDFSTDARAQKGVVELLWDEFGGTTNEKGYKVLNPAVGAIYGDAITIDRCTDICERLKAKGFASTNVVYGIGSYTYQYQTRDSLGFAMKATSVTINGEQKAIFKQPITDDGTKNSAKGRVSVGRNSNGIIGYEDESSNAAYVTELLVPLFENGILLRETTLSEIRGRLNETRGIEDKDSYGELLNE
jgi:nicotinamide phosphoribosyltransferase